MLQGLAHFSFFFSSSLSFLFLERWGWGGGGGGARGGKRMEDSSFPTITEVPFQRYRKNARQCP